MPEQRRPEPRHDPRPKSPSPSGDGVGEVVLRGRVLAALGCVRVATLARLRDLLTPDHASTAYVRRVALTQEQRGLIARVRHGRTDVWHLTRAGQAAITASGAPRRPRAATGEAALRGGLAAHALAVTATAAACVRHAAGPVTGWDVEVEHRLERRRLTADAVARLDTTDPRGADSGVRLVELDRATMPLHRLAGKIDTWTRWAEHRVHEGPRHPGGSTRAAWREQYPGWNCPPLWIVTTGAEPTVLRRRTDRLRPALHAMRALDRTVMRVYATTLEQLSEHGPAHRPIWTTLV